MTQRPRVALVTGGARRVGRAIIQRLVAAGFDVALTYHQSAQDAQALVSDITAQHRRAVAIRTDLTRPAEAAAETRQLFEMAFDHLDVLVNNASLYEPGSLGTTDLPQMRRMMAVHYEAPLLLCQQFAATLRASRGHVVNMVDLLAERPWPQYLAYCASKAALANLTIGLARELAPEVTVNGIAPGIVDWPDDYPQSERDRYLKRVPLGRAGSPQDVANLVHYLLSDGQYITGQIIRLDGGRSVT